MFKCANADCGRELPADHVILITTMHMRRFCTVECIHEGQEAHYRALRESMVDEPWLESYDKVHREDTRKWRSADWFSAGWMASAKHWAGVEQAVRAEERARYAGWPSGEEMIRQLLRALGEFDGAQPVSPQEVWERALAQVSALVVDVRA